MELERTAREIDKAQIDASTPGSMTISLHSSARCPEPAVVAESLLQLVQRAQREHDLMLDPLRLILVTANLGEVVNSWNRELGLPESGASSQAEGVAVGKHLCWGNDGDSARSVIIIADYIASAATAGVPIAAATVIHELGHIHDEFARGLTRGFRQSRPCNLNDWPGICTEVAENTWSEYAAESIAASDMTREDLASLMVNDPAHLVAIHKTIRQPIESSKIGQLDIPSLWSRAVTDVFDLFANLGRAAARFPFAENGEQARSGFVDGAGEAACWKPTVEKLFNELNRLDERTYAEWDTKRLEEIVALGFHGAGFIPIPISGGLRVNFR